MRMYLLMSGSTDITIAAAADTNKTPQIPQIPQLFILTFPKRVMPIGEGQPGRFNLEAAAQGARLESEAA